MTEANPEKEEPSPKEMESEVERQEVPMENVAAKPVGGRKKRQRGRNLTAGRRGKPTKLTRGDCESREMLVAACRKVSRRTAMAWRKRNISRKIRTQVNCGPRHELGTAGIRILTRCTGIAQRKEHRLQKKRQDDIAPRS
jgi:hypothetical protein